MKIEVGFGGLLFIVFLVLKLIGIIAWSWWWVTCPLWIGVATVALVFVATLFIGLIGAFFSSL